MNCKFCQKEILQPAGKRKKEYCNNTCRSNFWYAQNKKGKPKQVILDATKPTNQVKPVEQKTSNHVIDTRKPFMSEAIRKKLGL